MRKYKIKNRVIAFLLVLCFGGSLPFSTSIQAYGGVEAQTPHSLPKKANTLASLNLPREFGMIEVRHQFSGGSADDLVAETSQDDRPVVILIQDAHAIGSAQKSIQKILQHFSEQYGISLVGLEGASTTFDPLFLQNFPDETKREKILNQHVASGEISGAVAAAILSDTGTEYRGMENQKLYEEGIDLFLTALQKSDSSKQQLKKSQEETGRLKKKYYSHSLLELDVMEKSLENAEESIKVLKKLFAKSIDFQRYPHLEMLYKEIRLEQSPEKAAEYLLSFQKEILSKAGAGLKPAPTDRNVLAFLNEKTQAFQTQQISVSAYAQVLTDTASRQGADIPPAIVSLAENAHSIQKIRGEKIHEELETLFKELRHGAFKNDKQREIYQQDRQLKLLEKLIDLKLTRKEWNELRNISSLQRGYGDSSSVIASPLPQAGAKQSPTPEIATAAFGSLAMTMNIAFYRNAEAREEALYQNLRRRMKEKRTSAAAMLLGGFHSRGLIDRLKKDGVSYLLISPSIETIGEEKYLDYMRGEVSWKNYFRVENGRIDLSKAFSRAMRDRLLNVGAPLAGALRAGTSPAPTGIKAWRDQIIRSLANQNRLSKATQYTHFLDEISQRDEQGQVRRSGSVPYRVQWQTKVERFINDLKDLKSHNELTPSAISKILGQPFSATAQFPMAIPAQNIPAAWANGNPSQILSDHARAESRTQYPSNLASAIMEQAAINWGNDRTSDIFKKLETTILAFQSVIAGNLSAKFDGGKISFQYASKDQARSGVTAGVSIKDFTEIQNILTNALSFLIRSEVRKQAEGNLLFGVHEHNPDWWIMRTIGAAMLEVRSAQNQPGAISFDKIYRKTRAKLEGQGFREDKSLSIQHVQKLLKRMHGEFRLITIRDGKYDFATDLPYFAIQVHDPYYIQSELNAALENYEHQTDKTAKTTAGDTLAAILESYVTASESWHRYSVEARWPVLKAVSILKKEKQDLLLGFLEDKRRSYLLRDRPLLDAVYQLLSNKIPEKWLNKYAANLEGSLLIYISPETWLAAGGLGRVGQYHTIAAKKLMGDKASLVTIEPLYSKFDPEAGTMIPIDYSKTPVPVNLKKVEGLEFKVRASKRGQRVDVIVEAYSGINKFGIEEYFVKDKPMEGKKYSYFVNELYKYEDARKPLPYESATKEEFAEFFGRASLKLSKRIKFVKERKQQNGEIHTILWNNDAQSAMVPDFKRISDQLEERLDNPDQMKMKWNEVFGGGDEILIAEFEDLIYAENESSLSNADVHQTGHTYRNQGFGDFDNDYILQHLPYEWRHLYRSKVYPGRANYTRAGMLASDSYNGVSAIHAQEISAETIKHLSGTTNGDDREASREFFTAVAQRLYGTDIKMDFLTSKQIRRIKKAAKYVAKTDSDLLKLDSEFANLRSDRPVFSYSGRGVGEKLDHKKVFNRYNIEKVVAGGGQIVLFANVQADPEGKSQKMYEELKQWQREINASEVAKNSGGRLIVVTGWGPKEQRKLFAITDAAVYVSARDENWGTEAAGFTEADYALNGAVMITSTYLEGIFQQQGVMIDWNHPGIGNTVIAEGDESKHYLQAMMQVLEQWNKDPLRFAFYQAASIAYSRSLDALFTAGEYLRQFSLLRSRRQDPLGLLRNAIKEKDPQGVFFENPWLRRDLMQAIQKMPKDQYFEIERQPGSNPEIRSFAIRFDNQWYVIVMPGGPQWRDESAAARFINGSNNRLEELLSRQSIPFADTKVSISDGITGQEYTIYSVEAFLRDGLPVHIPEGFQVLRVQEVKPEAYEETQPELKDIFVESVLEPKGWNTAIRASLLNLIPDQLWQHLQAEGYDTEHILWHVQGLAPMEPESLEKKPLYAMVEKGKGSIVFTLTPSIEGLTDLQSRLESVFNGRSNGNGNGDFKAFAHIHLEAQGGTLFISTGKINMQLEEPMEHGVFKKWFREDLMPWAQELGFQKVRIEESLLSGEALQETGFLPTTIEKLWEFTLQAAKEEGEEGRERFIIPDAAAKRFLDFSGQAFVWKSDHQTTLLTNPRPGFLGWIFDFDLLESEGKAEAAVKFHNANTAGFALGDIWGTMESTVRGLESLKSKLESLKKDYQEATSEEVKIQKTQEAMHTLRDFVRSLAWKVFRDYVSGKEYARHALSDQAKAPILRNLIKAHLQQLAQTGQVEVLETKGEVSLFSVPLTLIYQDDRLLHQQILIAINWNSKNQEIVIAADEMRKFLEKIPKKNARGLLQAVDLAERTRLGGGTGAFGEVLNLDTLKRDGYSTEVSAGAPGIRTIFFESGEAHHLMDLLKAAVRTDTEEHGEEIRKELEYHQKSGNLENILKEISLIGKNKAIETFGEENLPLVMALIAGLSSKRLNAMKDWHSQTFQDLSKAFSRKNDREIYEKGAIRFHKSSSQSALIFSKTYEGRSLYFPIHFRKIQKDEEKISDSKKMIFLEDIENLPLIEDQNYQIRNKITRRLYSYLHTRASMREEGGWRIRVPKDSRYQILEIKTEEIKAIGVKHKFNNFMIAVNISDLGIEVQKDGKTVTTVQSFSKLKEILVELAQLGPSEIYIYGGVFKMGEISKKGHRVYDENRHFIVSEDGRVTISVHNYDVKSFKYTDEHGNEITVRDDAGNPFSIIRDQNGAPLLNEALFEISDKSTEEERQETYRRQFKEFNEFAATLGLNVFYDHIPWYAPEHITTENYREFFYKTLSENAGQEYQGIERERKIYRDTTLKQLLIATGITPSEDFLEQLSQQAYAARKQQFIDGLVTSNPGFFAVKIQEKGEERIVLIHHLNGSNVDQALPNSFSQKIREEQLNYMKFLIDHGAAGVRSDLAGKLLSYGNATWLGEHYTRPGLQYSAPFDVDDEFWKWLITESKRYARQTRRDYDPKYDGFGFVMEAYGDEERENLAKAGADILYFKEIVDDYRALVGGASPAKLNGDLQRAFQHHTSEWLKLLVFASNYDEKSFEAIGGVKHMQVALALMAAAGVPVMIDLRDLVDVGAIRTIPGGKDRVTKTVNHTMSTPEQAKMRDAWEKYKAAILDGSGFKLLKKLNTAITVKGQRYFKTVINSDHTVSGLAIQEPETGDWTMALGHHRLGKQETKEVEIQLPDEMFHDGIKALDEKQDLKFFDIETGESLPVENHKIKLTFSAGAGSAKIIRIESAHQGDGGVRSELRSIVISDWFTEILEDALGLAIQGKKVPAEFTLELIKALTDPNVEIRKDAAKLLGALAEDHEPSLPSLLDRLKDPAEDPEVRASVATAIGLIKPKKRKYRSALIHALQHDPAELVKIAAAQALQQFGAKAHDAVPALRHQLANGTQSVQTAVHEALRLIVRDQFFSQRQAIERSLRNDRGFIRKAALDFLNNHPETDTAPYIWLLDKIAKSDDSRNREIADSILSRIPRSEMRNHTDFIRERIQSGKLKVELWDKYPTMKLREARTPEFEHKTGREGLDRQQKGIQDTKHNLQIFRSIFEEYRQTITEPITPEKEKKLETWWNIYWVFPMFYEQLQATNQRVSEKEIALFVETYIESYKWTMSTLLLLPQRGTVATVYDKDFETFTKPAPGNIVAEAFQQVIGWKTLEDRITDRVLGTLIQINHPKAYPFLLEQLPETIARVESKTGRNEAYYRAALDEIRYHVQADAMNEVDRMRFLIEHIYESDTNDLPKDEDVWRNRFLQAIEDPKTLRKTARFAIPFLIQQIRDNYRPFEKLEDPAEVKREVKKSLRSEWAINALWRFVEHSSARSFLLRFSAQHFDTQYKLLISLIQEVPLFEIPQSLKKRIRVTFSDDLDRHLQQRIAKQEAYVSGNWFNDLWVLFVGVIRQWLNIELGPSTWFKTSFEYETEHFMVKTSTSQPLGKWNQRHLKLEDKVTHLIMGEAEMSSEKEGDIRLSSTLDESVRQEAYEALLTGMMIASEEIFGEDQFTLRTSRQDYFGNGQGLTLAGFPVDDFFIDQNPRAEVRTHLISETNEPWDRQRRSAELKELRDEILEIKRSKKILTKEEVRQYAMRLWRVLGEPQAASVSGALGKRIAAWHRLDLNQDRDLEIFLIGTSTIGLTINDIATPLLRFYLRYVVDETQDDRIIRWLMAAATNERSWLDDDEFSTDVFGLEKYGPEDKVIGGVTASGFVAGLMSLLLFPINMDFFALLGDRYTPLRLEVLEKMQRGDMPFLHQSSPKRSEGPHIVHSWINKSLRAALKNVRRLKNQTERAEVRKSEARKVAGKVLTAMATMAPMDKVDIDTLAAQARENLDGVVVELKTQAQDPKYIAMLQGAIAQPERFLQAHSDYQNRLALAVDQLIDQTREHAEDYLSANPHGNLNYAFAILLVNSTPETRAQLVKYFGMIQAIRAKYPDAKLKADFRILLNSKQRREITPSPLPSPPSRGRGEHPRTMGEGVFDAFVKFQRAGMVKFIEADQPGVGIQLEQFLRENPNALVYGSEIASPANETWRARNDENSFAHRYVESQVALDAQLPVAFILSDDLSQDQTHLQAELLRELPGRIARLHGSIIWNGRRLEVTVDALALIYQDYLSTAHIQTQA